MNFEPRYQRTVLRRPSVARANVVSARSFCGRNRREIRDSRWHRDGVTLSTATSSGTHLIFRPGKTTSLPDVVDEHFDSIRSREYPWNHVDVKVHSSGRLAAAFRTGNPRSSPVLIPYVIQVLKNCKRR